MFLGFPTLRSPWCSRWLQHRGFVVSVRFGTKVVDLNGRMALDWCSSAKKKTTTFGKAENVLIEVVLKIDWGWIFIFIFVARPFLVMWFGKDKLCYTSGIFTGFFESLLWDCAWSSAV